MIGSSIRAVRKQIGMDGKALAGMLGIDPSYLSRIENNMRNASPDLLAKIDLIASKSGVPSNLVGLADVNDRTARNVHVFMNRADVTSLRKESVRSVIDSLLKVE